MCNVTVYDVSDNTKKTLNIWNGSVTDTVRYVWHPMSLLTTDRHQIGRSALVREYTTDVTRDVYCDVTRDVDYCQPMSRRRVDHVTHQTNTRHRYSDDDNMPFLDNNRNRGFVISTDHRTGANYKKILRLSYHVIITYDNRNSNLP